MSTTYTELVSNIKAYSARTDSATIAAIPQFIAAAQTKLDSTLRIAEMITTTTYPAGATAIGPLTALEVSTVIVAGLEGTPTTVSSIYKMRAAPPAERHSNRHAFAMNGNMMELVEPQEVSLTLYQRPQHLSDNVQANAYTESASNALLWLSLAYLAVFTKDSESAQSWSDMAASEVQSLNESHEAFMMAGELVNEHKEYF
ncbi:Uncharacterised protein [Serratia quinivorans]|uniref:phage adaptor protein n=1 Tax=Serratia quinivorans TaxID=137545 RepID=UPI0021781710|nr:hypothetical protein [Serratia quinivorans]CAI1769649.1 Uncharacterised protein [Serratia quinivorans]